MDSRSTFQIPHDQPLQSCRRPTLLAKLLAKFKRSFERSTFLYQIANTTQILNLTRLAWTPSACPCIPLKCKVSLPRFPIDTFSLIGVDQSVRVGEAGAGELWLTTATTGQLLEAAHAPDGKILNALEFPMALASLDPPPKFSTDLLALQVAGRGIVPPTSDIRWGTAGTAGACTWFHIDSNGLGVGVLLKCGLKIWIFLRDDEGKLRVINCFQDFELDEANGYQLEVVVLRPGTRMYVECLSLSAIAILTLKNIAGSCVPILFMGLLHCFPPSATESIFLALPLCKIHIEASFTALWITSK
jgi:hypothetical protein